MNAWLTDPATNLPDQDNGAFNSQTIDPSAFLQQTPNSSDSNQFQRMFSNGVARTMSPGFQNPNQVIPMKRPRPDDGVSMSMSPRPAPGGLPGSRSQTPQQVPFPGYQGPANGASQFSQTHVPSSYPQFQPGTVHTSPSPAPQEFDPQATQRVHTSSPSPFSPAGMQVGQQMSPTHPDPSARVSTPQNAAFVQGQTFAQPVSQFSPASGMTSSALHPGVQPQFAQANPAMVQGFTPQQIAAQQRMYQMQLQNHARQMQAANPNIARPTVPGMNSMAHPQIAAMRQMQQNMSKPTHPEGFLRMLQKFMMARGLPLDTSPVVSGRPISLMQLYATVMKLGGAKKVTAMNTWPMIAQQLQFPQLQFPMAAQEIRDIYLRNLAPYEQAWMSSQQKQAGDQMQSAQRPVNDAMGMPPQASPTKSINSHSSFDPSQPFAHAGQSVMPSQHGAQRPSNGFTTPPQLKSQQKQQNSQHRHRSSLSRPPEAMFPNGQAAPLEAADKGQTPGPVKKRSSTSSDEPLHHPIGSTFKPAVWPESRLHGPVPVDELFQLCNDIIALKPNVPSFVELGVIDIHALTMSVKSGVHAEMRVALDTLTQLSAEPAVQISLDNCDDLVETLIECAEEQAEFLAENAAEASDSVQLSPYEDIMRDCRQEMESMLDVPEFGSLDYELDRSVDRLICITTILRNFSFTESNLNILAAPSVVKFMSTCIRYLGTRNMLLRTSQNTLDFVKDVVLYLSNVAHMIQLPGKDETLALLHLLLAFAPTPPPTSSGPDGILFPTYNPNTHRYLPLAVEGLAKLLARDDPNRTYFRAIFDQDSIATPSNDLLTRAFALAIAPLPSSIRGNPVPVADVRKPFLIQGMIAADLLSGFADNELARAWLQSIDGFAGNLLRLSFLLSADRQTQAAQQRAGQRGIVEPDLYGYLSIANRGLSVLCRLGEKAKRVDGKPCIPFAVLPKKENLLSVLLSPSIDPNVVRQLCEYAALG